MADDDVKLVVSLEARTNQLEKSMERVQRRVNDAMGSMEGRTRKASKQMEANFAGAGSALEKSIAGLSRGMAAFGAGIASGFMGAQGAQAVVAAAKNFTAMQNALKATGLEGKALESTFGGLFQIAQRNGTEMAPLVTLYSRMSSAQKELNASSADMMRFTEGVSLALKVGQTDAQAASGALLQLSQAMGGGKIQAEEYNSLIDGARPLLQAVAAGMLEAGGSVSKLTALVKDGKVSSEAFFRAALAGMPELERQASQMGSTVDQAMARATNAFTVLIGELDKSTGASQNAASNLDGVAAAIERLPAYIGAAVGGLQSLQTWLNQVGNNPFWKKVGTLVGVDFSPEGIRKNGMTPMPGSNLSEAEKDEQRRLLTAAEAKLADAKRDDTKNALDVYNAQKQVDYHRGNLASGSRIIADKPFGPEQPAAAKPISLANYAVKDGKGGGSGGGGGMSDAERRTDQVERYIEQMERSQRVLQAEFDTLGKSNAERAKAIELARIGTVTDQGQLARLTAVVDKNEQIRASIDKVRTAQQAANEAARQFSDTLADGLADAVLEARACKMSLRVWSMSLLALRSRAC